MIVTIETGTPGMEATTAATGPPDREATGASSSVNRDGAPNQPAAAPPKEAPDTPAKSRTSPRYRQSKTSGMNNENKQKSMKYIRGYKYIKNEMHIKATILTVAASCLPPGALSQRKEKKLCEMTMK